MVLDPGHYISLAVIAVGVVAWLIRLEGKVEANRAALEGKVEANRAALETHEKAMKVFSSKVEDDAKFYRDSREKFAASHQELRETMIRVEANLVNLTRLVEHLPQVKHPRTPPHG